MDVVFAFWEGEGGEGIKEERNNEIADINNGLFNISHFDLMLHVVDAAGSIRMCLEYCSDLFKTSTIEEFTGFYLEILDQVLDNPGVKLEDIRLDLHLAASAANPLQEDEEDWDTVFA